MPDYNNLTSNPTVSASSHAPAPGAGEPDAYWGNYSKLTDATTSPKPYDDPQTGTLTVEKSLSPSGITDTDITDQDFTFHLYGRDRADNITDFGTKTVTDGSSAVFDNLPLDQIYSLTEETPVSNTNWTFRSATVPAAGMNLASWRDLIDSSNPDSHVAVQNNYVPYTGPTGVIELTKLTDPPEAAKSRTDYFDVELRGVDVRGNPTLFPGTVNADGTIIFNGLPTSLTYYVSEGDTDIPGYTFRYATVNNVGMFSFSTTVTPSLARVVELKNFYIKDPVPASITIEKLCDPPGLGSSNQYTFQISEVAGDGSLIPLDSVNLKEGQSHSFTTLTADTDYVVVELPPSDLGDWHYSHTDFDGTTSMSVNLTPSETKPDLTTAATNHYIHSIPASITVNNACDPQGLGISSRFNLYEVASDGSLIPADSATVAEGDSYTFTNLATSKDFVVAETTPSDLPDWRYTYTDFDGKAGLQASISLTDANPNQSVTVTNHFVKRSSQSGSITLRKIVCPCGADSHGVFTFTLTGENPDKSQAYGPYAIAVSPGQSATFDELPLGLTYRLAEAGACPVKGWAFGGATVNSIPISSWSATLGDELQALSLCVQNRYFQRRDCPGKPRCRNLRHSTC